MCMTAEETSLNSFMSSELSGNRSQRYLDDRTNGDCGKCQKFEVNRFKGKGQFKLVYN
jgi:hypothetical protein